jgi:hypothetical protein
VRRPPCSPTPLDALAACLRQDTPLPLDADDALATMSLIGDAYRAAGFER